MENIYRYNQIINTYESLPNGKLNPTAVLNYFQEVAQRQIESQNIGLDYLKRNHLAWILVKYEITYHKYPEAEEEVVVETEPVDINRFEAHRRFSIYSPSGEELVTGKSVWVLIDTVSGRLTRINENEAVMAAMHDLRDELFKLPRLRRQKDFDYEREFKVRYSDIDINHHVNNVRYLSWALELIPLEIVKEYELEKVTIYFKEQAFYGDVVVAKGIEIEPGKWRINVEKSEGGILAEIEIVGRKIDE